MRRNSKLYHTPTLFLVNGHSFRDHEAAYQRGARDIINIDSDSEEISGRILELANYHRIHEQMKENFKSLAVDEARDKTSSAYSPKFMRAYLPRLLRDAAKADKTTTLIGLRLTCNSPGEVTETAVASAFAQTSELITNLLRMQDVICRWDENIFVLAFFNTIETEAENILKRIRSLLECTSYDSGIPLGAALNITATSTILEIGNNDLNSKDSYLDAIVANLIQDPDEP